MRLPLVSVIVPIYNVETYLNRCVDSILTQTYHNLEIILVDDGSSDGCGKICDEYAITDKRVKVIHRKNGGLSAARNSGLNIVQGEYIVCVDSDDWILPCHIEWLFKGLSDTNTMLCICQSQKVTSEEDMRIVEQFTNPKVLDKEDVMYTALTQFKWWSACDKLFHRDLFRNIRFPEGRTNEDYAIIFQIFDRCSEIAVINVPTYCYFTRQGSITTSTLNIHKFDQVTNSEEVLMYMEKKHTRLVRPAEAIFVTCCLKLLSDIVISGATEYEEWRKKMIAVVRQYRSRWIRNPYIFIAQKILLLPLCVNWRLFVLTSRLYHNLHL
ncbi:glycosyltransferase family 2 protein [Bacteroides zhangwenhongii]|uniref:glycosyltransferase family 2 protein n=1 Tax=Bacteroides zhangwenhongii TaxID=2650157 RepID=UPI003AAC085F